jgi:hypothetical protein
MVASTGGSANGIESYMAPLSTPQPPQWLKSQYNIVGVAILHQTTYQGGAYREGLISGWLTGIGEAAVIAQVQAHEGYSDFWNTTTLGNGRWGLVRA